MNHHYQSPERPREISHNPYSYALSRLEGPHIGQRGAARERGQPPQPRLPNRVALRTALVRLLVQGRRRRQLLQQGRSQHKVRVRSFVLCQSCVQQQDPIDAGAMMQL